MIKCGFCKEEHKDKNTGCKNSGDYNSGNRNSGYCNSGYCNSGDRNSGNCNSGNYNSGCFNTNEPKMRFFNKDSDVTFTEFNKSKIVYPDLKIYEWVELNDLPKDEQSETAKQMGGLLKTLTYKEAWKEYWDRVSQEDKEWFTKLPNFSQSLFLEITGIEVATTSLKGKKVLVELDGVEYTAIID